MIALIKDTSLDLTITVAELARVADQVGASTFRYIEMFLLAGLIYWIIKVALRKIAMN
ncbi:hypothetical protein PQR53_38030 [Paraburkholderia fungorum]|uniref:hypothetical protein n=1 Tax=Paraburkholderia fungorum TaxID=134537 RepID=UPI0038B797FA